MLCDFFNDLFDNLVQELEIKPFLGQSNMLKYST